jgi:Base plate wedge protein 53.
MDRYFTKLPVISYNDKACRDISRSVRLTPEARKQSSLYYPVQIDAGFRADNLAEAYYEDAEMDWMIWLTNDIVDPYYEWYLSEREFENFIVKKYGSFEAAQKKILFYRSNWYKLDETISTAYYNNNITSDLKKYYTPVFGPARNIIHYKRREEDWTMNTNRMLQYNGDTTGEFQQAEIVDIMVSGFSQGQGTIVTADPLVIQHVSGNTVANSTWTKTIQGQSSSASMVTNEYVPLNINITDNEAIYWDPITALDVEWEDNEKKKNLLVVNADYANDLSEQIRISLKSS